MDAVKLFSLSQKRQIMRCEIERESILCCLLNRNRVAKLLATPGQRYRGVGGEEAAATRITRTWKQYKCRWLFLRIRRVIRAAKVFYKFWKMRMARHRLRHAAQQRIISRLPHANHLIATLGYKWPQMQCKKRTLVCVMTPDLASPTLHHPIFEAQQFLRYL